MNKFQGSNIIYLIKDFLKTKWKCIISIWGESWGGKSYISNLLKTYSFKNLITIINLDDYYKSLNEINHVNDFDSINWFNINTLKIRKIIKDIDSLSKWFPIRKPIYSFEKNKSTWLEVIEPQKIIIFEWIHAINNKFTNYSDLKIYITSNEETKILRILARDIKRKNFTIKNILDYYLKRVNPMNKKLALLYKNTADIVILNDFNYKNEFKSLYNLNFY